MGEKLGFAAIRAPDPDVRQLLDVATELCLMDGVEEADIHVATGVEPGRIFAASDVPRCSVLVFRTAMQTGADALAEALHQRAGHAALAAFENDFYQSGGFQIWEPSDSGTDESGDEPKGARSLLVDGAISIAGQTIAYGDVARIGLARFLDVDPQPAQHDEPFGPQNVFVASLLEGGVRHSGSDFRIFSGGEPVDPPRPLAEGEAKPWQWDSTPMHFPMFDGAAARKARRRVELLAAQPIETLKALDEEYRDREAGDATDSGGMIVDERIRQDELVTASPPPGTEDEKLSMQLLDDLESCGFFESHASLWPPGKQEVPDWIVSRLEFFLERLQPGFVRQGDRVERMAAYLERLED